MFSYDGKQRPTIEEIRNHPWMNVNTDVKTVRQNLVQEVLEKQSQQTADTSRESTAARGDRLLELVKQQSIFVP